MENRSKLVNEILNSGITQLELANFLKVTRQTVKRLSEGFELTCKMPNFELIEDKDIETIKIIIQIYSFSNEIIKSISSKSSNTIEKAYEGYKYLHHWCLDPKYDEKFIGFIFGHITNFHMRYNPFSLLLRDFFYKEDLPLLTFNIDYHHKNIKSFYLIEFDNDNSKGYTEFFNKKTIQFPIAFEEFIDLVHEMVGGWIVRCNVYLDRDDDELGFIEKNIKKSYIEKLDRIHYYDLSRMFNYFENNSKIGPLIEDVLTNFNVEFDKMKILTDPKYRGEKIVDLVNMVSLSTLRDKSKNNSIDKIFNGSSKNSNIIYTQDQRRRLK